MDELGETDELPVVAFTKLAMNYWSPETGRPVVINPDDMEPRDSEYCTTFYVMDPDYRVFEVSTWENRDLDNQREVLNTVLKDPRTAALEPSVLKRFGAEEVDRTQFGGDEFCGLVFDTLIDLTEWAHVFQMEDNVTIVGTPTLTGRVSVNVKVQRA